MVNDPHAEQEKARAAAWAKEMQLAPGQPASPDASVDTVPSEQTAPPPSSFVKIMIIVLVVLGLIIFTNFLAPAGNKTSSRMATLQKMRQDLELPAGDEMERGGCPGEFLSTSQCELNISISYDNQASLNASVAKLKQNGWGVTISGTRGYRLKNPNGDYPNHCIVVTNHNKAALHEGFVLLLADPNDYECTGAQI